MTDITAIATAQAEIRRRVAAIGAGQWDLPTPCTDWSVTDLVVHLIAGSAMTVLLLEGASGPESLSPFRAPHGPDLEAELDRGLTDELAAFGKPDAFEPSSIIPPPGTCRGRRCSDSEPGTTCCTVGTWPVPPVGTRHWTRTLVVTTWDAMQPMAPFIAQIGIFGAGPSGTVGADAPLQQRFLDFTGRRP